MRKIQLYFEAQFPACGEISASQGSVSTIFFRFPSQKSNADFSLPFLSFITHLNRNILPFGEIENLPGPSMSGTLETSNTTCVFKFLRFILIKLKFPLAELGSSFSSSAR